MTLLMLNFISMTFSVREREEEKKPLRGLKGSKVLTVFGMFSRTHDAKRPPYNITRPYSLGI